MLYSLEHSCLSRSQPLDVDSEKRDPIGTDLEAGLPPIGIPKNHIYPARDGIAMSFRGKQHLDPQRGIRFFLRTTSP